MAPMTSRSKGETSGNGGATSVSGDTRETPVGGDVGHGHTDLNMETCDEQCTSGRSVRDRSGDDQHLTDNDFGGVITVEEEGDLRGVKDVASPVRQEDSPSDRLSAVSPRERRLSSSSLVTEITDFPTPTSLRLQQEAYREGLRAEERPPSREELQDEPPLPPATNKEQLLTGRTFIGIDQHALKTPGELYGRPLSALVERLVAPAEDDIERVRAVFRWVSCQHITTLQPREEKQGAEGMEEEEEEGAEGDTVLGMLLRVKIEDLQYADLFAEMCRHAGVTCRVLHGYVKGAKYVLGDPIPVTSLGSWNAVLLGGSWRLVDPHWGSRHVITMDDGPADWVPIDDPGYRIRMSTGGGGSTSSEILEYRCNEFYFLTDPEVFVFTHLPEGGACWQLLARPVTEHQFSEMAYVKPEFFSVPLRVLSHARCVIHDADPHLEVTFGVPEDAGKDQFKYKVYAERAVEGGGGGGGDIGRFLFMALRGHVLSCLFRLPRTGRYKFELYAKSRAERSFSMATAYVIECCRNSDSFPLPGVNEEPWGPGREVRELGLTPVSHPCGLITATSSHLQIEFDVAPDDMERIELATELLSNEVDPGKLARCVVHRLEGGQAILNLTLPEAGEYALQIFGKRKDCAASGEFPMICNYLVQCTPEEEAGGAPVLYPALLNGKLGTVPNADGLHVTADPEVTYLHRFTNEEMQVRLRANRPAHYLCELHLLTADDSRDVSDHVLYNNSQGQAEVKLRFPTEGTYHLSIYSRAADPSSRKNEPFANVYNYMVMVHEAPVVHDPFPRPFDLWSAGCVLIEPEQGVLPPHTAVRFAAVVPGARRVAVVGKEWAQLTRASGEMWEGEVDTGDNEKLTLTASYTNKAGKAPRQYNSLLVFKVAGEGSESWEEKVKPVEAESVEAAAEESEAEVSCTEAGDSDEGEGGGGGIDGDGGGSENDISNIDDKVASGLSDGGGDDAAETSGDEGEEGIRNAAEDAIEETPTVENITDGDEADGGSESRLCEGETCTCTSPENKEENADKPKNNKETPTGENSRDNTAMADDSGNNDVDGGIETDTDDDYETTESEDGMSSVGEMTSDGKITSDGEMISGDSSDAESDCGRVSRYTEDPTASVRPERRSHSQEKDLRVVATARKRPNKSVERKRYVIMAAGATDTHSSEQRRNGKEHKENRIRKEPREATEQKEPTEREELRKPTRLREPKQRKHRGDKERTEEKERLAKLKQARTSYSRPPPLLSKEERERLKREEQERRERGIRERLRVAIASEDRMELERAVRDFRHARLRDTEGDYTTGALLLDFLRARDSLLESMTSENLDRLRLAVRTVERGGHEPRLRPEMLRARKLLESLERIERLRRDVLNMDASTWSEVRRYTSPHPVVHKVIIGALLVLGDHEGRTKHWINCQIYLTTIGADGLNRRVGKFNVDDLHPGIAARAKVILQRLDVGEVREVSAGVGTFYTWAVGMIEEFESRNRALESVQPASVDRQKEILRGRRPPTPRDRDVSQPFTYVQPPASPYTLERSATTLPSLPRPERGRRERRAWEQAPASPRRHLPDIRAPVQGRRAYGLKAYKAPDHQARRVKQPKHDEALLRRGMMRKANTSLF